MIRVSLLFLLICSVCQGQDLQEAILDNNVNRVRQLLDAGANPDTTFDNGLTPLQVAEDRQIVELLFQHGAQLDIPDAPSVESPLEHAASRWCDAKADRDAWKNIVTKLREGGAEYTLEAAIYMDDVNFVRSSLKKDESWVNKPLGAKLSPLRFAAMIGRVDICRLLLDLKADPNAFAEGNGFPILISALRHPPVVQLLIQRGANLKQRITWQECRTGEWIIEDDATALHYAAESGCLESLEMLVKAGLDTNAVDTEGQTPLHVAIRAERRTVTWYGDARSYQSIVEYLLANNTSTRVADKHGRTPLELAKELGSPKEIQNAILNRHNVR